MTRTRFALLLLLLAPAGTFAQGFFVGDNGAAPAGMGGAGVAFPVDLATAIYNPAGIVRVKDGAQGSLAFINFNHGQYDRAPDAHNDFQDYPTEELERKQYIGGPFAAAVTDFGMDKWKFGVSTVLQFGSKLDFDQNGVQRYMMKQVLLFVENQNFIAAYEIDDHWSVGGSLVWAYASVEEDIDLDLVALLDPNSLPSEEESNRIPTEVSLDDNAFGANIGVLRDGDKWKLGFMYHSPVTLDLKGDVTTNLVNIPQAIKDLLGIQGDELALDASMELKLPQYARLGASFRPTDKVWVSGEFFWIDWSVLKAFDVKLAPNVINVTSYVIPRNWDDGYAYKAGVEYSISDDDRLRAGLFYVDAPTKRQFIQLDIPDNNRVGVTMGWAHDFTDRLGVDVAYIHQFLDSWHIEDSQQNPPVNGDIEVNFGTLLLGARWNF